MIQKIQFFSLPTNPQIVLIYKNKILLISEKTTQPTNKHNTWSFFEKESLKSLQLINSTTIKVNSLLFCIKLTDKNVNDLKRKEDTILEFYTFKELDSLKLSLDSKTAFETNKETIRTLLDK